MNAARDRRGFALVAVLWILVAVGAAAVSLQMSARVHRLGALNAGARAETRWAARDAYALTMDAVERLGVASGNWEAVGLGKTTRLHMERGGAGVTVSVQVLDARSRLNLNLASAHELDALLAAVAGTGQTPGPILRDRILDWRDADHQRRPGGGELEDYLRADRPAWIADAPFQSVDELGEVVGVSPEVKGALEPFFTVTGDGLINVNTADARVLATLPGIDLSAARALVAARQERPISSVFGLIAALPLDKGRRLQSQVAALEERTAFSPRDLEVVITAEMPGTAVRTRILAALRVEGARVLKVVDLAES